MKTVKEYIVSLQQDITKLDALIELLETQYELLSQRNVQLETHNKKMLGFLESLNESHNQRDGFLVSLGLQGGKEGLAQLTALLPADINSLTTKLLHQLELKTKTCKIMNQANVGCYSV